MPPAPPAPVRHLLVVLGDQLDADSPLFHTADPRQDVVLMAEVTRENTKVWVHQARSLLFLSAMRHFREERRAAGWTVHYHELGEPKGPATLGEALQRHVSRLRPAAIRMVAPGEWSVREELRAAARSTGVPLEELADDHFYCSPEAFAAHAATRKQLRLEFFYRELRQRHGVLLDPHGSPEGGEWNYDAENRESFGREGPGLIPRPVSFAPDALTRETRDAVRRHLGSHPGSTDAFDWPVTRTQALAALADFIQNRLADFGRYQDALWTGESWLYHSRLAAALNLKLLRPREVVQAAEAAYRSKGAGLASTEGFIRQILGWREYVRGIYWRFMPEYLDRNALGADEPLPAFYWTGATDLNCLREALGQTLRLGYAHHIQRLMVTGLFALLLGVHPRKVHEWYLAVYVDAVEWVELPNTLGMSQYADGGVMASKPYIASGKYLRRMSNYCAGCRYSPDRATGPEACPFTLLYWDFLQRHEARLAGNPRMTMQVRNLSRLASADRARITREALAFRERCRRV